MKMKRVLVLVLMAVTALWAAEAKKYVKPTENNVGIYKEKTHGAADQPLFTVGAQDRLVLVKVEGDYDKVANVDGVTGWVDKRLMVSIGSKNSFSFENAEVLGYIDNPTPIYIIDQDDPNAEKITLDRSFKDALRDNVDKLTLEREVK
jgi:hypothetical protein